ncbi:major membrane immunogen (membrane-anchored lipoprotein) [Staphylococcus epidermidis]|uniref:hypothetical protein n=1 Tax=Staphylococcus epidermidis TaxID=1282 RepID=UPI001933F03A|nr:hypothetical protein [Staphylococcus epidermidis]MBM0752546.1 hypothetical protein [Staphylococcus epidermidis]MBM0765244.1 hypothetical protein [Staphylococcus epidermidis]MBM0789519.1 hypothetical protein [Staphylococcus epidermidis]MCG1605525.1 hypothetical protein [Staphylococcus epidermidis]
MKRILLVCLSLVIILTACGNKLDGTYKNKDLSIKADRDSKDVTLHINELESTGFLGVGENDGNLSGEINRDKNIITFENDDGNDMKINYKLKGNKLIIDNPLSYGNHKKIELTKEKQ